MLFINPEGKYPRHVGDLQIEHRDWQAGDELPEGWILVQPTPVNTDPRLIFTEEFPELVDGVYYQKFSYVDNPDYIERSNSVEPLLGA